MLVGGTVPALHTRTGGDGRTRERHRPEPARRTGPPGEAKAQTQARVSVRTVSDRSTLQFTVTTVEGDTVELSLSALSVRQVEKGSARGPEGSIQGPERRIKKRSVTQADRLSAQLSVNGDLNSEELEDIQNLLAALSSGGAPEAGADDLDTISGYFYAFARTREVEKSSVTLYA